ncbi:hypothetical protein DFH06DRAFT_1137177 [Mycena polygramma]|nr:hypothetical protein DFH06DRAFT_1137177 [Mycena polygramma]
MTIELLMARLDRTGHALSVSLRSDLGGHPIHPQILYLLSQHSQRRETLLVLGSLEGTDTSVLRGRLPMLKNLWLTVCGANIDFFEGWSTFPFHHRSYTPNPCTPLLDERKLRSFEIALVLPSHFPDTISLLPRLPTAVSCILTIYLAPWSLPPLDIPSVTASIFSLHRSICGRESDLHQTSSTMNRIFASLTLPNLQRLLLGCRAYPRLQWEWPHREFLVLRDHSDFSRCLKTLCITEVRIKEKDLLEVLSCLQGLEETRPVNAMTPKIRSSYATAFYHALVPHLAHLTLVSNLAFNHGVLVDLVKSRLARHLGTAPLHLSIHPLPIGAPVSLDTLSIDPLLTGAPVSLDSTVNAALSQLAASNRGFLSAGNRKVSRPDSKFFADGFARKPGFSQPLFGNRVAARNPPNAVIAAEAADLSASTAQCYSVRYTYSSAQNPWAMDADSVHTGPTSFYLSRLPQFQFNAAITDVQASAMLGRSAWNVWHRKGIRSKAKRYPGIDRGPGRVLKAFHWMDKPVELPRHPCRC